MAEERFEQFIANGKVFAAFQHGALVFKLAGAAHAEALALPGATLWDPSDAGQPFRAWVAVPAAQVGRWEALAEAAVTGMAGGR